MYPYTPALLEQDAYLALGRLKKVIMKIIGYVVSVLVMVLSASSIGLIPALILGTLIGAVINMLVIRSQPESALRAPPIESVSIQTKPKYDFDRILQAAKIEERGDWLHLLAFCQEWAVAEPYNCLAWQGVGDSYRKLAQPENAVAAYEKGLAVAPAQPVDLMGRTLSSAPIWYRLGHAFCDLKQLDRATSAFREATRVDPNEACIWNDLGVVFQAQNEFDSAIEAFQKAVSIDPQGITGLRNLESMQDLVASQRALATAHQDFLQSKSEVPIDRVASNDCQPTVKERLLAQAAQKEAEQRSLKNGLAKLQASLDAKARDINVESTLDAILINLKNGDSLRHSILPVSWGWSAELRDTFVADIEAELARGVHQEDAVRVVLEKFSTR